MSRIYFHSEHGTAAVRGSERHFMGVFIADLFGISLGLSYNNDTPSRPSKYRKILVPSHYLNSLQSPHFNESLRCALSLGIGDVLMVEGTPVNLFTAQLNTAINVGNDQVKLMARLHGQCEIHCYVEGVNRNWLANIIEKGILIGLFRESEKWPTGWRGVIELLRSRDDCPVVTSYSICEQFPNPGVANWTPPKEGEKDNWDAWYDLPTEEQWRIGLEGLRADSMLEMRPDNWDDYYHGNGLDGFGIAEAAATTPPAAEPGAERSE